MCCEFLFSVMLAAKNSPDKVQWFFGQIKYHSISHLFVKYLLTWYLGKVT